jgi:hypothetical protein
MVWVIATMGGQQNLQISMFAPGLISLTLGASDD